LLWTFALFAFIFNLARNLLHSKEEYEEVYGVEELEELEK